MKFEHYDGMITDTTKLPDVDAELIEACHRLNELFIKYGRQLLVVAEARGSTNEDTPTNGITFFNTLYPHLILAYNRLKKGEKLSDSELQQIHNCYLTYLERIGRSVYRISGGQYCISPVDPNTNKT